MLAQLAGGVVQWYVNKEADDYIMARRKGEPKKLTKTVGVRLTEVEVARLEGIAAGRGLYVSEVMREIVAEHFGADHAKRGTAG